MPRIGFVVVGEPTGSIVIRVRDAFRLGLREYGRYVEGETIIVEYRYGPFDRLPELVRDLVHLKVELIVAGGTPPALAAKQVTHTIPIVVPAMADPVADGLVTSLGHPGGNVTGVSLLAPELGPKRLQLLREVVPNISRVAVLQHPGVYSERTMRDMGNEMARAARAVGVEIQMCNAKSPDDIDTAFVAMAKAGAGGLVMFSSPMFYIEYRRLIALAAKHRIPTAYHFREAPDAGGLMCYGANIPDLFRRAGSYVDRILKGAKPADLPIEQPAKYDLVVNVKTAKELRLTIPPSLIARADQVIE